MNNELISLQTAIEWAREEIAIEGEDFVYGADQREFENSVINCYYYENGRPSCIVGRILDHHGLTTASEAEPYEGEGATTIPCVKNNFSDEAVRFLGALQVNQDWGKPWGLALKAAIERVRNA